ncbi:3-oxoacyl-ACP reductase family protein [Spirosoma validum]|uniref:3-oxoacyl-ACP reductase FabG n=1 Tax=Spirosoma validum TaxID=2771355 RepID=A0A927GDV4_9BACT|nr:3-oxoacyl-ACP reductase family protein [Spirosoma validum]MBD2754058.1 3-oxoacyl-ACP reductase FabG [Spirosoma validum]
MQPITDSKVVLVTGGTRGIGRAICLKLASLGHTVVFTYITNEALAQSLVEEINAMTHAPVMAYRCDMTKLPEVQKLFKEIKAAFKRVDAVVNNAGILGDGKPFMMSPDADWWHVFQTNVSSVTNTCRAVLATMISQRKGRIINITSLSGQKGNPGQSAYSASKSAIVTFSRSLYKEVGQFGITVNCVSPGLIETDMTKELSEDYFSSRMSKTPLKRKGTPEEVANVVSYLICEAPTYMIGQELTIDGGIGG